MAGEHEQVIVADRDTMVRYWLKQQVASGRMKPAAADQHWKEYSQDWQKLANYFSVGDDIRLMQRLVKEVGINGRCYYKRYGGKLHVVFKGRPGLRQVLTGTKYGVQHAKVVSLGIGRAGVLKSVKGGTVVSVILLTVWNIVDFVLRDNATLGQLVGGITADVTKAVIANGVGYAAASVAIGLGMTVACGPLILAVVVGVGAGWALDAIDKKYKLTEKLQNMLDIGFKEMERRRNALAAQGRRAMLDALDGVVDLARDAVVGGVGREVRRQIDRFRWSPVRWSPIPRLF